MMEECSLLEIKIPNGQMNFLILDQSKCIKCEVQGYPYQLHRRI